MNEVFHRTVFLEGAVGKLEAMLWTVAPGSELDFAAVVCHPHPLFGGTMHNKVVYQAAKALHKRGIPVLRFNFRGAGRSEGQHDQGLGERQDVRVAIDYLAKEFPSRPIILAGFSFGSWVGLRVGCEDARAIRLIGLGIPVERSDLSYLLDCKKPKLIIQGANDEFGPRKNVEAFFAKLPAPKRLEIVEGADHFFAGRLHEVAAAIDNWLDESGTRKNEPGASPSTQKV